MQAQAQTRVGMARYDRVFADDEAPEPPRATGQYPDPIWLDEAQVLALESAEDEVPEPPRATGQYPDPIWLDGSFERASTAMIAHAAEAPFDPALVGLKEADYAEEIGDAEDQARERATPAPAIALDTQAIYRIIRAVALADSADALYSAVSADAEFATADHPAYQQRHFGLAFGLVRFTQESGRLGSVLRLMQRRDPQAFAALFGPSADELLAVTNAATPEQRLATVAGEPLWSAGWIERFRQAGEVPAFQAAQNEEAIEGQFRPMLRMAFDLGLNSDRALAMVYDRVVAHGLGGGLRWVVGAAGVLRTAAQRAAALRLLGMGDLPAFQRAVSGLPQDGRFGPATHTALVAALRDQDLAPLPTLDELIGRLVAAAAGPARQRLERLRSSTAFQDLIVSP